MIDKSDILTKKQLADLLGVTTRFVERQVKAGNLKATKLGYKTVRYLKRDVEAYLGMHRLPWPGAPETHYPLT
jgi:excisionase family DNA binding protein